MTARALSVLCSVGLVMMLALGAQAAPAKEALMNPDALSEQAPETYQVDVETSKGRFVLDITRSWAPLGADRFYNLVKNGFYDDVRFFRVMNGFVAQFGMNGDPELTKVWQTARIEDDPVVRGNKRGTITFATSGKNSRTTQVFINFKDNNGLDRLGFAAFGKVAQGMSVVDELYSGYGDAPPGGTGPRQVRIQAEGNAYLKKSFPKLDYVKKATIVPQKSD